MVMEPDEIEVEVTLLFALRGEVCSSFGLLCYNFFLLLETEYILFYIISL